MEEQAILNWIMENRVLFSIGFTVGAIVLAGGVTLIDDLYRDEDGKPSFKRRAKARR